MSFYVLLLCVSVYTDAMDAAIRNAEEHQVRYNTHIVKCLRELVEGIALKRREWQEQLPRAVVMRQIEVVLHRPTRAHAAVSLEIVVHSAVSDCLLLAVGRRDVPRGQVIEQLLRILTVVCRLRI